MKVFQKCYLLLTEALSLCTSLPLCTQTQSSLPLDGIGIPYVLTDMWSEGDPNVFCLHLVRLSISFMLSDSTHNLSVVCGE